MQIPKINDKNLLKQIFTHRSYLNESESEVESNERLEFLGDSILSFVVSTYIYKNFPDSKEGELTSLRSVLTNTDMLYKIAQELDLGKHLLLSRGEEAGGGRTNKSILANTFEAFVGGIFIDQGIEATTKFIEEAVLTRIDSTLKEGLKDPKSLLQETIQEKYKTSPLYKIVKEEGPDHDKSYTSAVFINNKLLAEGSGKSKQEAEKEAAKNALSTLLNI